MQKFGSYHLQRLPGWGKMPVHVNGETVASVSWSINSCFFGFGNRVKKQGWTLFSFCSVAATGFDRMSGSFFTSGLRTGHLRGRAPPIGAGYFWAGYPPHYGRAPPVCLAFRVSKRSGTLEMNEKRETQHFCEKSVSLNPQPVFNPIRQLGSQL